MKANQDIRNAVMEQGFKLWELAEALGINDGNLSRKLRRELPSEQKEHIFRTIERMAERRAENARIQNYQTDSGNGLDLRTLSSSFGR